MNWTVYILQCANGTLYTGITNDLDARISAHEAGTGAKYTWDAARLNWCSARWHDRASASRREIEIKALSRMSQRAIDQKADEISRSGWAAQMERRSNFGLQTGTKRPNMKAKHKEGF